MPAWILLEARRFDVVGRLKRSGIDVIAVLARPRRDRLDDA